MTADVGALSPWCFRPSFTEIGCLAVGSFLVSWYAWLIDDAYVYFRYVDNLVVHGQGLVWNPGEYVEGFTSPAWVLILSCLRLLHLDYWLMVRGVEIASFFAFWWLACVVNRRLAGPVLLEGAALNVPLVYLSCTYGVVCYFTSGLESPLVMVVAAAFAAGLLWPQDPVLLTVIGLSPLVRPELAVPYVLYIAYSRWRWRIWPSTALVSFALSTAAYGLFRIWYYADLFPNAFYLKEETWPLQGLAYLYDTAVAYQTVPLLLAMAILHWKMRRACERSLYSNERVAMVVLAVSVALCVAKVGGDPRHFRYLAFPFGLATLACGGLVERTIARVLGMQHRYAILLTATFGLAVLTNFPRQLQQHPLLRTHLGYAHRGFMRINDAAVHRYSPDGLTPPWWQLTGATTSYRQAQMRYRAELATGMPMDWSPVGTPVWRSAAQSVAHTPGKSVLADSWCYNGYLHAALPVVHALGLTDPFLARTRMRAERPAHKLGLLPLAEDLLHVRSRHGFGYGAFDMSTTDSSGSPDWIRANLDVLRLIERKAYNDHRFADNLRVAFLPVGKVEPNGQPDAPHGLRWFLRM